MILGELVNVVRTLYQSVMVKLLVPDLHQMQEDLRVLRVVLPPAVVESFTRMRQNQ